MLESLLEIEIAYSMLQSTDQTDDVNPIDAHYEKLNTEIEVVDKDSEEFELLKKYVQNTHAKTHQSYALEITEVRQMNFLLLYQVSIKYI